MNLYLEHVAQFLNAEAQRRRGAESDTVRGQPD